MNFALHADKQPNTQKIKMTYQDRFNLIEDPNTKVIRVKTQEEIELPKIKEYRKRRKKDYPTLVDQMGAIIKYLKTKKDLPRELDLIVSEVDRVKNNWQKLNKNFK